MMKKREFIRSLVVGTMLACWLKAPVFGLEKDVSDKIEAKYRLVRVPDRDGVWNGVDRVVEHHYVRIHRNTPDGQVEFKMFRCPDKETADWVVREHGAVYVDEFSERMKIPTIEYDYKFFHLTTNHTSKFFNLTRNRT